MNYEYFVDFETGKRLKKLGFDYPAVHFYDEEGELLEHVTTTFRLYCSMNSISPKYTEGKDFCDAPTMAQTQAWLRDVKHIYVYPEVNCLKRWFAKAVDMERNEDLIFDGSMFDTYEQALSAGITECLNTIESKE